MPLLADAEARRRIGEDLGATFFVEAAAGTGKTSALVSRIVALLRTGRASLEQIAAVTFTEKAAGEMKLRLRAEIERVRREAGARPEECERLDESLSQLELASIGTIHAFCGDLLRERPVEARVGPLFEVASEDEARRLLDRAFDQWFQDVLAQPSEGVKRVLRRRSRGRNRQGPRELLRTAVANLKEHRDFPAAWRREVFDRDAAIDAVMRSLLEVAVLAKDAHPEDWLARSLQELLDFCDENELRESVRGRDHDGLEAELRELARSRCWRWRGAAKRPFAAGLPRAAVIGQRDAVKQQLDAALAAADADLAALLREELRPVIVAYEELKQRAGRLDFLDLLLRARDLIRDDRSVREEVQSRFCHFFVDEFQDTDPLQAEILLLLASDEPSQSDWRQVNPVPGKLFLVGDPKQSIYRFRRADVAIYEDAKQHLLARGAEVLHLSTSFRSLPSIQQAVNAAFELPMSAGEGSTQAAYVALQPYREDVTDRPGVVALPVPKPYGDYGRIAKFRIEESFPDAVGAFVDWLVHDSGWTIEKPDEPGQREPIQARHVCLLFKRFKSFENDITRPYVRALEARRVPHVLVGGRSFHEREEVAAPRNALGAIEWPDDELRVFATLRGPLFALADDALLAYRHRVGRFHAQRRLDAERLAALEPPEREVVDALSILDELHRQRNRRPIAETLSRLLAAVRAHAGIAIWPTGEQALVNCLRVVDLARKFEFRGAPSFRAFAEHMELEFERGEAADAPVVEEGTEGVRIMTVHRAKGLEFPVVVLADPTCNLVGRNPSRHIDPKRELWAESLCGCQPLELQAAEQEELRRDAEEAVRVAYVAATRARELLVIPALGDEEQVGWIDVLNPAVYPESASRRDATPAPGCPEFGDDSVLDRGPRGRGGPNLSVRPGLHVPRRGAHRVAWWDPRALDLGRVEQVGLRQERMLVADEDGSVAQDGADAHADWQRRRRAALLAGRTPSLDVRSVTALSAEPEARAISEVGLESVAGDRSGRPGGKRFGILVHAVLATVPLRGGAGEVEAIARIQGRLVDASEEEVAAAVVAVCAALEHPLLRRAGRAAAEGGLRRETPVLLRLPDGVLAEGFVDLAFREDGVWTVVDFKTDRELAGERTRYEAQVGLYVQAIAAATSEPARGVLLRV